MFIYICVNNNTIFIIYILLFIFYINFFRILLSFFRKVFFRCL